MCYFPNTIQVLTNRESGELRTIFHKGLVDKNYDDEMYISRCYSVPCGECLECLEQYSNVWAYRCTLESHLHKENCMVTLTYDDLHNPISLKRRDVQLFLKRLRKAHKDLNIRYFGCGEYGGQTLRPHYHLILFGYKPKDLQYFKMSGGHEVYLSGEIEHLWGKGFITVTDVTMYTAKYSAKYLQKMQNVPSCLKQPFTMMSLKPGIGYGSLSDVNFETDKIYVEGRAYSLPRYFLSKGTDEERAAIHRLRIVKLDLLQSNPDDRRARRFMQLKRFGKLKK